jgi:hypothetical protein
VVSVDSVLVYTVEAVVSDEDDRVVVVISYVEDESRLIVETVVSYDEDNRVSLVVVYVVVDSEEVLRASVSDVEVDG